MSDIIWTGPDGVTRRIPVPSTGAPNFISGAQGTAQGGLPATTYPGQGQGFNPKNLPTVQPKPGTGFKLGQEGPTIRPQKSPPLQLGHSPTTSAPAASGTVPRTSAPAGGGGFSLGRAAGKLLKGGGLASAGLGAMTMTSDAMGAEPTYKEYTPGDPIARPTQLYQAATTAGKGFDNIAQDTQRSFFTRRAADIASDILQAPGRIGQGIRENTEDLSKYFSDNLLRPSGEVAAERKAEAERIKLLKEQERMEEAGVYRDMLAQNDTYNLISNITNADSGSETITLGNAPQSFGGYQVPAPPKGPDYSKVQEALDQTQPVMDEAGLESRRKGAILSGLVGGLLSGAMRDDMSAGQILGMGGLGIIKGMAKGDEDRKDAKQKFKKAMDEYWIRTSGVRRDQAESEASYANRVWQTRLKQLSINASAAQARAQAGAGKLREVGGKYYMDEIVNGKRQLRPLDMGLVNRTAGITNTLKQIGVSEDQAKSMVGSLVSNKSPMEAMPILALGRMKENGNYNNFVTEMMNDPDIGQDVTSAYNAAGQYSTGLVTDESEAKKLADRQRDAYLMELMFASPAIFKKAMDYGDVK